MGITLDGFVGVWTVTRRIGDATGAARFDGQARFTPGAGGVDYAEAGMLTLPGGQGVQAERRYRWTAQDGGIAVYFDDGRFFHAFDPAGAATARHFCDPDTYDVAYEFGAWPDAWSARWSVTGPRKNYVMTSRYARAR